MLYQGIIFLAKVIEGKRDMDTFRYENEERPVEPFSADESAEDWSDIAGWEESRADYYEQELATTKAELTKTKEHLAIEESECVRLCNEKNRFKAELQAEKAKAALDEISEIGQEMSLNSLKHDAVIEASLFIRSRITMNNIHCDDRSIGKRDILSLLDEYAESMQ